jgi:hypothetical protein
MQKSDKLMSLYHFIYQNETTFEQHIMQIEKLPEINYGNIKYHHDALLPYSLFVIPLHLNAAC